MSTITQGWFQGIRPTDLLVSYVLSVFSDFSTLARDERIRIRFLFQQFARKFITPEQLMSIASFFHHSIQQAAAKLIQACLCPRQLVADSPPRSWTPEETMLLIASAELDHNNTLPSLIPARTESSWRRRLSRVIDDLRLNNVLDDNMNPALTLQQTTNITLYLDVEHQSEKSHRIAQGMRLARAVKALKTEASTANARLHKQIHKMERIMNEEREKAEKDHPKATAHSLSAAFMLECNRNAAVRDKGRRYSDMLYDLSELLRTSSRKAYKLLREILPLPCDTALYGRYVDDVNKRKKAISEIECTKDFLTSLFRKGKIPPTPVTIGIDAFSFQTFNGATIDEGSTKHEKYSNGFIFVHIPLDSSQAPMVIHLQKKSNGAYDDTVASNFEEIRKVYQEWKIPIWFKATDGDRYLTAEHDKFFQEHVVPDRHDFALLLQKIHDKLRAGLTMPIPDPLHYGKNIRGKIIDHQIAVVDHDETIFLISSETLQDVLELGDVFDDKSNLGRMRDVYITKLFTLRNVCKLLKAECYPEALLFLPYSCIFTVLYATNLSTSSRVFLAKLAYVCFDKLLHECESLVAHVSEINHRWCDGTVAVTIAEPSYIRRMMHSCLAIGICLVFAPRTLRLDAIGTHIVENSIGLARSVANSTKYTNILSAFAKSEIRKKIARKYNIKLRVSRRVNDGGAKIDTMDQNGIKQPDKWDAADIASMFVESCNQDLMAPARKELKEFLVQLTEFTEALHISELADTSEVANALIVQRNYKFKAQTSNEP